MKGYVIEAGYMGYVDGAYMLFADEEDYQEYFREWLKIRRRKIQGLRIV